MQWAGVIERMILFEPETVIPQHSRPIHGSSNIRATLIKYRDAIQFVHDQTMRLANKGKKIQSECVKHKIHYQLAFSVNFVFVFFFLYSRTTPYCHLESIDVAYRPVLPSPPPGVLRHRGVGQQGRGQQCNRMVQRKANGFAQVSRIQPGYYVYIQILINQP